MDLTASTAAGTVRGQRVEDLVEFRGIPYGSSTGGTGRFRPAAPPREWSGVRDCLEYGPIAPQGFSGLEAILGLGERPKSEDCLTLNIVTPGVDDQSRPVMVWLHGGGFMTGAGSLPFYRGRALARRGAVVVTPNYRLGALGFCHLGPVLGPEFSASGGVGLADQIAALRWVRDNIAAFGGDPDRVTVFGESAGAMSVGTLLGSPAARGLFHRAVAQSGAGHHVHRADTGLALVHDLLHVLGEGDPEFLLAASVDDLLRAQSEVARRYLIERLGTVDLPPSLPFQPVVGTDPVPRDPVEAVAAGQGAAVPLIVGSNADEMRMFTALDPSTPKVDADVLERRTRRLFGASWQGAVEAYRAERDVSTPADVWCQIDSDRVFTLPALRLADAHAASGHPAHLFRFTYRSTALGGVLGACHAMDVPFVFDLADRPHVDQLVGPVTETTRVLSRTMADTWVGFAATGAPSVAEMAWPEGKGMPRRVMEFGSRIGLLDDPYARTEPFWSELI